MHLHIHSCIHSFIHSLVHSLTWIYVYFLTDSLLFCHLQVRPNDYDHQGLTLLHRACEMGNVSSVKFLVALGAHPNIQTHPVQGSTPAIVFAASNGHPDVMKLLVDAGADVDNADNWGNCALFKAACYNHIDCVRMLLLAGANPNLRNRWGALPLQYAALQGHYTVVQLLLEAGAKLDLSGETTVPSPLIGAAMRGYPKCVNEILKRKPDLEATYLEEHHTAVYLSLQHFLLNCDGYYSTVSNSGPHARFQCVYLLLLSGAQVSLPCLDLMCCSDMIPYLVTEEYILLMKLLLRAFRYTPEARNSFQWLFEHVTCLGPHKWGLLQLICSVGFTPSQVQLSELSYTLMDAQYEALSILSQNPRPLTDQCRRVIRAGLCGENVICAAEKLPLPQLLKDFIAVKQVNFYVV